MSEAQEEAVGILSEVLPTLFAGDIDLTNPLRRCAHVCRLLGWDEKLAWCEHELNGYPTDSALPVYRNSVVGNHVWLVEGGMRAAVEATVDDTYRQRREEHPASAYTPVPFGLHVLQQLSQSGLDMPTGRRRDRTLARFHKTIGEYEVERYPAAAFQQVLRVIESALFAFASESYTMLRYRGAVTHVIDELQQTATVALSGLGLEDHFKAITDGLTSDNPERWRQALYECRNALQDLAKHLWQDPRKEYAPWKDSAGRSIRVTEDKFANRLRAYLHQKGLSSGKQGQYVLAVLDEMAATIGALTDLENTAHAQVELVDVQLAAVGTYLVLAELATRTDLKPVTQYTT